MGRDRACQHGVQTTAARLKFAAGQSDEGVFLRPVADGPELRLDRYIRIFPKTIQAQVPATLTGPQRLIVRHRTRATQPQPTQCTYDTVLTPT